MILTKEQVEHLTAVFAAISPLSIEALVTSHEELRAALTDAADEIERWGSVGLYGLRDRLRALAADAKEHADA